MGDDKRAECNKKEREENKSKFIKRKTSLGRKRKWRRAKKKKLKNNEI